MVLSAFVMYWWILHYHKYKVKYIELGMMKVILIRVIKEKKVIKIVLKSKMTQLFWDTFFLVNDSVIMGWSEYNINNNDSPRTRCERGKPPKSIYKIKVAKTRKHHQSQTNYKWTLMQRSGCFHRS